MPKINCATVGYNSSTYGVNKWKKEPCLEHGDKNVVKGHCPNYERSYSLCGFFHLTWQRVKREMNGFKLSNDKIQTEQNGPQNAVIGFVHYIL